MKMINGCLVCNKDDTHIAVDAMVGQFMDFVSALKPKMKEMLEKDPDYKKRALATVTRIKDLVDALLVAKDSPEGWPKKCTFSCPSLISKDYHRMVWSKDPEFVLDILVNPTGS